MAHLLTQHPTSQHDSWKFALFAICFWLWATDIGLDPPYKLESPPFGKIRPNTKASPIPRVATHPMKPRSPVGGRLDVGLDLEAFRVAFSRQATIRLIPCLREWTASPAQVLVKGTLQRKGVLRDVISLDPQMTLPSCAEDAIEEMDLSSVALGMNVDTTTVQWRIDW
jgi:hypothetical protein